MVSDILSLDLKLLLYKMKTINKPLFMLLLDMQYSDNMCEFGDSGSGTNARTTSTCFFSIPSILEI